jgi:hypothetical protein
VPNVQWKTPDDGQRNCPKHVEFLDKINLGNECVCWFYSTAKEFGINELEMKTRTYHQNCV